MRIVELNMLHNGSTGKIMLGIADCAGHEGNDVWTFSPVVYQKGQKIGRPDIQGHSYFGLRLENMLHLALSELTGLHGCFSVVGTWMLLRKIDKLHPDVIHLHNLHNCTINIPMLFAYIKRHNIRTVWTLHDCWAFTGKCPHFTMAKCSKWKTGCHDCTQIRSYPKSYVDRTELMWMKKREWFSGIADMTIITPSHWLAGLLRESFLREYPIRVIHNGIALDTFKPTDSDFRQKYHLEEKKIVLGVAFDWGVRKGLDVFIELSKRLPSDYRIVLVGTNDKIDAMLPANILSIHRTNNQRELAEIYSAADVFANPTREDNFPTVNIEALACGTPVITFRTGGSPESLTDDCGSVVPCDDTDALQNEIIRICEKKPYSQDACTARAQEFEASSKFLEYVDLYRSKAGDDSV